MRLFARIWQRCIPARMPEPERKPLADLMADIRAIHEGQLANALRAAEFALSFASPCSECRKRAEVLAQWRDELAGELQTLRGQQ